MRPKRTVISAKTPKCPTKRHRQQSRSIGNVVENQTMPGVRKAQGSHIDAANRSAGMKSPCHVSQSCSAVASVIITQKAEIITQ